MTNKQDFIEKWSTFFILKKDKEKLKSAMEKELNEIIKSEINRLVNFRNDYEKIISQQNKDILNLIEGQKALQEKLEEQKRSNKMIIEH